MENENKNYRILQNLKEYEISNKIIPPSSSLSSHSSLMTHNNDKNNKKIKTKRGNELINKIKDDSFSLSSLEQGLEVMNKYLEIQSFETNSFSSAYSPHSSHSSHSSIKERRETNININDCIHLKNKTKEKIKNNIELKKQNEYESMIYNKNSNDLTSKHLTNVKPPILQEEKEIISTQYESGLTFLTDVDIEEQTKKQNQEEDIKEEMIFNQNQPVTAPTPSTSSSTSSNHKNNNKNQKIEPITTRKRNLHSVESLLNILPKKEIENIRRHSIEGGTIQKVLPSKSTIESTPSGPDMLDRQVEWMYKLELKKRAAIIEKEKELIKEVFIYCHDLFGCFYSFIFIC